MMYLLLPFLSVVLGYAFATWLQPQNKKNIKLILSFSGSFLLSITVLHLLPELYTETSHGSGHGSGHDHESSIGIFIMIGIMFQIVLEFFSKGAEHGHVHGGEHLKHIPITLFISLSLHALLEGMPVSHHHNLSLGISIHHFPIAIILTAFFVNSGLKKTSIMLFMIGFAIMTPLGTIISENIPQLLDYHKEITAVVVGILFHISSTIIFESNEGHKFNILKLTVILLGVILAYFI